MESLNNMIFVLFFKSNCHLIYRIFGGDVPVPTQYLYVTYLNYVIVVIKCIYTRTEFLRNNLLVI